MQGKRPRLLQRTASKSQISQGDACVGIPAMEALQEKPIPLTPSSGFPRQVFGFNPVSREHSDAVPSPRSVFYGLGSECSHVRSSRSQRSGLGSLFCGSGFQEGRGFEGVGIGTVQDNRSINQANDVIAEELVSSPQQTEPRAINLTYSLCAAPSRKKELHSESPSSCNDSLRSNSGAWSFRGLQSCSNEPSVCGAVPDVEMETCDSIFSTSSPASSWSENCSVSLLETDFLNACLFCKRHLGPGKDIYMYRGDKAFCSTECRYQQIVLDERKERCSASRLLRHKQPHKIRVPAICFRGVEIQ